MKVRYRYTALELDATTGGAEEQWNILREVLKEGAQEVLLKVRRRWNKPWMTKENLDMMAEKDETLYRNKTREMHQEQWLSGQSEEVEKLCRTHQHSRCAKIKN